MNKCRYCHEVVDPERETSCPFCGEEIEAEDAQFPFDSIINPSSVIKPAKRPKIQVDVTLGITIDATGSSSKFQVGIPLTTKIILTQLETKARSVHCYLQTHRDEEYKEMPTLITNGGMPSQVLEDLKSVKFTGGGDAAETHLDAIANLLTLPWDPDFSKSRGAILAILNADTKPLRNGRSIQHLAQEISERNLLLYLVCEPYPQLQELIDYTRGMMFPISNSPEPGELQKIATQLGASIIASVSKHSTVPIAASSV